MTAFVRWMTAAKFVFIDLWPFTSEAGLLFSLLLLLLAGSSFVCRRIPVFQIRNKDIGHQFAVHEDMRETSSQRDIILHVAVAILLGTQSFFLKSEWLLFLLLLCLKLVVGCQCMQHSCTVSWPIASLRFRISCWKFSSRLAMMLDGVRMHDSTDTPSVKTNANLQLQL